MYQMDTFGLGPGPDCRLLEMDYEGGDLSMLIALPRKVDGLAELERKLDGAELSKWLCTLVRQEVMVYLPRFRFEDKIDLKEQLWGMGMESAFELGRADFSGMSADARAQGLSIDQALHRACLEVNEEGSEAAGATVVEMEMLGFPSEEEPEFRADHPFIFLIRDKHSGVILFLGRVMDPRG
jgi:serpin B